MAYAYVDLSRSTESPGTSWISRNIPTMSWGRRLDPLLPRDEHDGILFIDTAHHRLYPRRATTLTHHFTQATPWTQSGAFSVRRQGLR
jgi:hypothetical protein